MKYLVGAAGIILIAFILIDVFKFIILPRRVDSRVTLARVFLRGLRRIWIGTARRLGSRLQRENLLSYFGPIALILLFGLWALGFILGFALLGWSFGTQYAHGLSSSFLTDLYTSGTSFFTLGFADITPSSGAERVLSVLEAAVGFGFLGLVISYLPLFYQSFAEREILISMLDEWAGSPPSAGELLRRLGEDDCLVDLEQFLKDWEKWSAELLERHLSYPILGAFRSQHENQSWVTSLTMILDLCALIRVGVEGVSKRTGRLTYAIAMHAVGDLTQVYHLTPNSPSEDRLPPSDLQKLREILAEAHIQLRADPAAEDGLALLRAEYEPYVNALAEFLFMELPPWFAKPGIKDNWQTTAWSVDGESHF
jgi:hypothetical protein